MTTPTFPTNNPQQNDPINSYRDPKLLTPRQVKVLKETTLPVLPRYPRCPGKDPKSEEENRALLEDMFRGFVFDLFNGT